MGVGGVVSRGGCKKRLVMAGGSVMAGCAACVSPRESARFMTNLYCAIPRDSVPPASLPPRLVRLRSYRREGRGALLLGMGVTTHGCLGVIP